MSDISETHAGYGSKDRSLRKYIALSETLERVLDEKNTRAESRVLPLRLARTWIIGLSNYIALRGVRFLYSGRDAEESIVIGTVSEALIPRFEALTSNSPDDSILEVENTLFLRSRVGKSHLSGVLEKEGAWEVEDIGWIADSVHLLQRAIARSQRRELDKMANAITSSQVMLKELRPNSLYYNLIRSFERVAGHTHSSTVILCSANALTILAEVIRYPTSRESARIGLRLDTIKPPQVQGAVLVQAESSTSGHETLCSTLYGVEWGRQIHAALVISLTPPSASQQTVIVLADARKGSFDEASIEDILYLANRTDRIIATSEEFVSNLGETSKALDNLILWSQSANELVTNGGNWARSTFDASAAWICLPDKEGDNEAFQIATDNHGNTDLSEVMEILGGDLSWLFNGEASAYRRLSGTTHSHLSSSSYAAVFGAPLSLLDRNTGFLLCGYKRPRQPSPFDSFMLESAAQRIGAALTIMKLGDRNRQLSELRKALRLMELVAAAADDHLVVTELIRQVQFLFGCDYVFVSMPDHNQVLHLQGQSWSEPFTIPPVKITGLPGGGTTSVAAYTRKVHRSNDVTADVFYIDINKRGAAMPVRSEMAGPLVFDDSLLGVICLMSSRRTAFSERDETLLRMLLAHSAIVLAHARSAREAQQHIRMSEDLHSHLLRLNSPGDIYSMILNVATAMMRDRHRADVFGGDLYVKNPKLRVLELKASQRIDALSSPASQYFNEGIVGTVADLGISMFGIQSSQAQDIQPNPLLGIRTGTSLIAVPVKISPQVDAVISLSAASHSFLELDRVALEALAAEIALAVRFAQLNESVAIDQRRQERERDARFLLNISHEVAKSARATAQLAPQLEKEIRDRPSALRLLARIQEPADRAINAEERLLKARSTSITNYERTDVIFAATLAGKRAGEENPEVEVIIDVRPDTFEIECGPEYLSFIFTNILDNALEAMDRRGSITIREHAFDDPLILVIDILDTGSGIPQEKQSMIWEPYYSDDGTGRKKGSGIGMWLVRDQMERLGGWIELYESTVGAGSTFRLTFPEGR